MLDVGIRTRTSTQKICQMQSVFENIKKVKWQYRILTGGAPPKFFYAKELNVKRLVSFVHWKVTLTQTKSLSYTFLSKSGVLVDTRHWRSKLPHTLSNIKSCYSGLNIDLLKCGQIFSKVPAIQPSFRRRFRRYHGVFLKMNSSKDTCETFCTYCVMLWFFKISFNIFIWLFPWFSRSSCPKLFWKKVFCNIIKKESLAQVFSCEFCEISKNNFFTDHLRWLLLVSIVWTSR